MPRAIGQVDESKTEAILDAAAELTALNGAKVSMEAIAKRAGVSKQTLYNRFPSRLEIARALAARRSDMLTQPLRSGGDVEAVLTAFAAGLLEKIVRENVAVAFRSVALMSAEVPELADAVYQAGPGEGLRRLSAWLAEQDRAGALNVPDPDAAAEMFAGMTLGHSHLRAILGVNHPSFDIAARARDTARRFLRAFAV
ncbi:TetR/AcrR family transcriptional regulator [Brevundimonas aveniformis]|uniref:TetR/AcrR family transcriptional regulator n=1 Tax=Brevundimonas aveniformis TaxID=370977 RepID=UPI0004014E43|nr:TetR/AcrR family transcriptional regulator [Brevundimonas aveniformis]